MVLEADGFRVVTAKDAKEAIRLVGEVQPKLILMDVQLPGINGLELTKRIKADVATRDITVIALTAFAMKGDDQKAFEAGCSGYVTKPVDTRTLSTLIRFIFGP